jgi:hypothetical protein
MRERTSSGVSQRALAASTWRSTSLPTVHGEEMAVVQDGCGHDDEVARGRKVSLLGVVGECRGGV